MRDKKERRGRGRQRCGRNGEPSGVGWEVRKRGEGGEDKVKMEWGGGGGGWWWWVGERKEIILVLAKE